MVECIAVGPDSTDPYDRFSPREELRSMVSYAALKAVCAAGDDVERQRKALKKLFGSFVKCDKNVVRTQVKIRDLYSLDTGFG